MKYLSVISLLGLLSIDAALALDIPALEHQLGIPERPAQDKARDSSRKAPQVLDFLGLERGMTVLDIAAAAGWYTEVLSHAVGGKGKVYMQNPPGSPNAPAYAARAERLGNVEVWDQPIIALPANSIDFAITALNYHDAYNVSPAAVQALLVQVKAALKPGGILAVIDHEGVRDADNAALHRITFKQLVSSLTESGFALVAVSELLDNPADDHSLKVDDPRLNRTTDRMVLRLINP